MKASSIGGERKEKMVCSPQWLLITGFSMGFQESRYLGFYYRVIFLKVMKAKGYWNLSVHSALQDHLFLEWVTKRLHTTDFEVRLTQHPSPHCSAHHLHFSYISAPQLLNLWNGAYITNWFFPWGLNKFSESPWQGLSQDCLLSGFLWVQTPVMHKGAGPIKLLMSTRKDKTLTHREEQGSDTEELPWMRWGLSEETVSILTERLFMVGSSLTEHIGYVTKPAFARETCQTVGWQHFPPLALYPLACFTFPQDTPRMQVAMDIIREQLYLCSTPECESLRMWHHERLRKMPLHPATGTWCKKRRNILCVPGEETCQSQEQTMMHYGQLWEHLTEAKVWPETQVCF